MAPDEAVSFESLALPLSRLCLGRWLNEPHESLSEKQESGLKSTYSSEYPCENQTHDAL